MNNQHRQIVSSRPPSRRRLLLARAAVWLAKHMPWLYEVWSAFDNARWAAAPARTELRKPLPQCRVALVTSGGIILRSQEPFDLTLKQGDCSYRVIPADADMSEVVVSHLFYDRSKVNRDPGVMLPLAALHTLVERAAVGSAAPRHYSFSGGIPNPAELVTVYAPEVAAQMLSDEVDLALLTPA